MNLASILSSEVPIPSNSPRACWHCDLPAIAYWPGCSDSPRPYCEAHLKASKTRLQIALGGQGELHMQWPTVHDKK